MKSTLAVVCAAAVGLICASCVSEEEIQRREDRITRILMVGNSFSISVLSHLPQVAADRGVDLDLASLYLPGCTLKRHWENAKKGEGNPDFRPYSFDRNELGKVKPKGKSGLDEALRLEKWDVVTVQQGSHESWRPETYHPYGDDLVARIRKLAPQAKVVVQETWSYTPWDKRLAKWGIDADGMYERLHAAYAGFAEKHGLEVIPFGAAVQEWRRRLPVRYGEKSFGGDVVGGRWQKEEDLFKRNVGNEWEPNCDVFHLNERGEYFQALVWAARLMDVDLMDLEYRPDFVTESDARLMKEIAMGLK